MILGIDYGLKNIGLAISEGSLATPEATIKAKNSKEALNAISQIIEKWSIDKIVIGVSEGKSKQRSLGFGKKLQTMLRLKVEFVDETLTTKLAGTGRIKDKNTEHARAAAIILQRYLDNK